MSSAVVDPAVLARVDALLASYCAALDVRDMRAWLACFASDGQYELTTLENVALDLPVGLMLDDCPERLRDRVKYVEEVWNHAVEHYQTRHLWTRAACSADPDGMLTVRSHFVVYYTTAEGQSALLTAGHYADLVTEESGALRLRARRAILDTTVPPRYLIYPI